MTTDKPSPVAGPASEPAPLHHIINMRWAYEQACDLADWANANGTTLGNDEKLYQAAIKLRDTLGKATHAAQPVPAPAVDERTNTGEFEPFFREDGTTFIDDLLKEDLAAASNGSHGGTAVVLHMTAVEAEAVHHALYLRLRALSMTEDHNPDPHRRREAVRVGDVVLRVADRLKELLP